MSEKDFSRLYTDERYLFKSDLKNALGTSLVDGYWNDILRYRSSYIKKLSFRTIGNTGFYITLTPAIEAKIKGAYDECVRLVNTIKKMEIGRELEESKRLLKLNQLTIVNSFNKSSMDLLSIKALLNGTYRGDNPGHAAVIAYLKSLNWALSRAPSRPNADYFADAYTSVLGGGDLTSFYRTGDPDARARRAMYIAGSDFPYAPYQLIDPLMEEFFSFVANDEIPLLAKAIASIFFVNYVSPLDNKNIETSSLLGLDILAYGELGNEAFYLPLLSICEQNKGYEEAALLSERTGDLTYVTMFGIDALLGLVRKEQDDIKEIKLSSLRKEATPLMKEEEDAAKERGVIASKESLDESSTQLSFLNIDEGEKPIEEKPAPMPKPAYVEKEVPVEEKAPIIEEAVYKEVPVPPKEKAVASPRPVPVKVVPKVEESHTEERSLSAPESQLSEKEVKEYVQYLLESNPNLNKNQASFLASHCTLGRFYNIQQYKKFTKCAYETARTSMDKLAEERYYEKLQVKNKFVYRPIKQGE